MTIPFVDLKVQCPQLRQELTAAMEHAVTEAHFILGHQVESFECQFANYCGADHCIGVGSGTDALHLTLRGLGLGPGDEVITAANSFIASALAITYTGATPVLVDVDPYDYNLNVELLERAITPRTKAILPVHLFGQPANLPEILRIAQKHGLFVVQDACQAHGARIGDAPIANFGDAACFSFYPSKNLGAFGDGGAVVTNHPQLAERVRMLRNYGQRTKNNYAMLGFNSRLDTLQAAILAVKLRHLDAGNQKRQAVAAAYRQLLADSGCVLPVAHPGATHVYHLFVVQHHDRDRLLEHLRAADVQCGVHYPEPIHDTITFRSARTVPEGAPVSRRLATRILSLPMYPELSCEQIRRVASAVKAFAPRSPIVGAVGATTPMANASVTD
jgi:dTDP-4-amino-4,6-dideoxygalactose transaminase